MGGPANHISKLIKYGPSEELEALKKEFAECHPDNIDAWLSQYGVAYITVKRYFPGIRDHWLKYIMAKAWTPRAPRKTETKAYTEKAVKRLRVIAKYGPLGMAKEDRERPPEPYYMAQYSGFQVIRSE